jgi:glutamate racemase
MKIIVIDSGFGGKDFIKKAKDFINKCDCVVLGCTHYNIIKN